MRAKALRLRLARAVVVVVVEPGLADGHDLRMRAPAARSPRPACRAPRARGADACRPSRRRRDSARRSASVAVELRDAGGDRDHRADPGRSARADDAVESAREVGKIEMAVVSTSIKPPFGLALTFPPCRRLAVRLRPLDVARKHRPAPERRAGRSRPASPSASKRALRRRPSSRSSSFAAAAGIDGLGQDRHLPHHLRGDVEDGLHALRIGLALGPRLLAGEIAVGVRHHAPTPRPGTA